MPYGCYGRISARSDLALKVFTDVDAGVMDLEYRGKFVVILLNFGKNILRLKYVIRLRN